MKDDTLLAHSGRDSESDFAAVNPPVHKASTSLFPTLQAFNDRASRRYTGFSYGIHGTPTTAALAEAAAELEGGRRAVVVSSGLAAITLSLMAYLRQGDHILVADTVYGPSRAFCTRGLSRLGVETTFYDPLIGAGISELMRPNTRVVFAESPGSLTFEVQDIPAIAKAAHAGDALVMLDNTWATPLYFKPFSHGVDVSIHAGTKYIGGHSDLLLGLVTVSEEEHFRKIKDSVMLLGDCVAPDTCYQALKGLRSLGVRLRQHEQSALRIAQWLQERPEVKRVLHPALPGDPGHDLWKRDFKGASGLFGVVLHTSNEQGIAAMIDDLRLFGIGASWGGYESLVIPANPAKTRTAVPWEETGYLLRFSVGLEAVEDLLEDLTAGFERLNRCTGGEG